jgi:hypothetical protein
MNKIFNSIGHALAWVLQAVGVGEKAVAEVETIVGSPVAAAIAALAGAKGPAVQSAIEAIAGDVLAAFEAGGEAIAAKGLNIAFDEATIAAIKTLYSDLKAAIGGTQVAVKATPIAAADSSTASVLN